MKHKFIPAAIMALSLLFGTVANAAGNELPISHGNRYTVNRDGGGGRLRILYPSQQIMR